MMNDEILAYVFVGAILLSPLLLLFAVPGKNQFVEDLHASEKKSKNLQNRVISAKLRFFTTCRRIFRAIRRLFRREWIFRLFCVAQVFALAYIVYACIWSDEEWDILPWLYTSSECSVCGGYKSYHPTHKFGFVRTPTDMDERISMLGDDCTICGQGMLHESHSEPHDFDGSLGFSWEFYVDWKTLIACLFGPVLFLKPLDWVLAGKDKDMGNG